MSVRKLAAVVGTFDGVHNGHRHLLDGLKRRARELHLGTCVYTFTDHPMATLHPDNAPKLLSTVSEKITMLDSIGIDRIQIGNFADIASMTAREYIRLLASQGVELLMIGYDNRFGSDGLVSLNQFQDAANGTGVIIEQADELTTSQGDKINSSSIRNMLATGNISTANELLGYEYPITGIVVKGKQLGRTIGFPTANLELPGTSRKQIVANGVYACHAIAGKKNYAAMVNIGHRPTVDLPDAPVSIEAHLIDCNSDLYNQAMTLRFVALLRTEQRFPSLEALKAQLTRDRQSTLETISPPH